jgi:CrcB protein
MSGPGLWAAVAVLGGLGALARYLVDVLVGLRLGGRLPLGTLAVNVSGSLVLGALSGAAVAHGVSLLAGAGFLGAYTTFSTWLWESLVLAEDGRTGAALANLAGLLALGLGAAALGWAIGSVL